MGHSDTGDRRGDADLESMYYVRQQARQVTLRFAARQSGRPLAWSSPSGRWAGRGLRGQRRAAGASCAAGCEVPLRPEGLARTMRGASVLACSLRHSRGSQPSGVGSSVWPWCWRAWQSPRRSHAVGLASEGRGESCLSPLNAHVSLVRMARPAGFEPATRCLEGTFGGSLDVACCHPTSYLAADTIAGRRRASCEVCLCWLPDWLPGTCWLSPFSSKRN